MCLQVLFEAYTDPGSVQASISLKSMVEGNSGEHIVGFGDQGTEVKSGLFQKKAHTERAAALHVGNHGSREKHCRKSERN